MGERNLKGDKMQHNPNEPYPMDVIHKTVRLRNDKGFGMRKIARKLGLDEAKLRAEYMELLIRQRAVENKL